MSVERQSIQPPHFVISSEGEILGEDSPENQEIVRRVVACVNACDGITTEELESGIIADMRKVIAQTARSASGTQPDVRVAAERNSC